jgi:hypothetical protein
MVLTGTKELNLFLIFGSCKPYRNSFIRQQVQLRERMDPGFQHQELLLRFVICTEYWF